MSQRVRLKKFYLENIEPLREDVARFIYSRTHNQHLTEDLLQEVMLKAFQKSGQLREEDSCKAWMLQIARNQISEFFRKENYKHKENLEVFVTVEEALSKIDDAEADILAILQRQEDGIAVYEAIESLEPFDREVVIEHLCEDKKLVDIAVDLNKNDATIRSVYRRALEKMRKHLAAKAAAKSASKETEADATTVKGGQAHEQK